ncbi:hypothetical protein T4D_10045 [Trichinella pseudospiralis]|uniref:Uncharacterized protein n=1 Tax=Trichinella pseudospiralis TaxID=6337 RepID=A0A0V1FCW0_TRIPS|nr:hypothetical protein T4D_10045 [Trichinella pseudospiralis]
MYTACAGALFSPSQSTSLQKSVDLSINFQFTFRRLSTIFNHVLNKRVLVNVCARHTQRTDGHRCMRSIPRFIPRFHNRRTNKSANAFCQLQKLNLDCFTSGRWSNIRLTGESIKFRQTDLLYCHQNYTHGTMTQAPAEQHLHI